MSDMDSTYMYMHRGSCVILDHLLTLNERTNEILITDSRSFESEKRAVKRIIWNTSACEVFRLFRFNRSAKILRFMWNCLYMGTVRERKEMLNLTGI